MGQFKIHIFNNDRKLINDKELLRCQELWWIHHQRKCITCIWQNISLDLFYFNNYKWRGRDVMGKAVSTGRNFTWFNTLPIFTIFRFRCWWVWNIARQTNIEVIHFPSFFIAAKNKQTSKTSLFLISNYLFLLFF